MTLAAGTLATRQSVWLYHVIAVAAALALIGIAFRQDIVSAVEVWWFYPAYSHCFLIIPVSAWLVWEKREQLASSSPAVAAPFLLLMPLIVAFWLVGDIAAITELRQFAIVAVVQIVLLALLGMRIYRTILFPALFLFFLVPTGQFLIPPLQHFTTRFADLALNLIGIPHFTEGTVIEMPNGDFEVAEACAGLRFLTAALAVGAVFSYLSFRRWMKILLFLLACVIVPILGNGLRVVGILLLAYATNNRMATGADHLVYGWGFSVAILIALLLIGSRFSDPDANEPSKPHQQSFEPRWAFLAVTGCLAFLILAGPLLALWRDSRPVHVNLAAFHGPLAAHGWASADPSGQWHPDYGAADAQLAAELTPVPFQSARSIDIAIEYFGRIRDRHKLLASSNRPWNADFWHPIRTGYVSAHLGESSVDFSETLIGSLDSQRLVWSTYWLDDRFTSSELKVRLLQLRAALSGKEGAAVIAASVPVDTTIEDARVRMGRALAALRNLRTMLAQAGTTPQIAPVKPKGRT